VRRLLLTSRIVRFCKRSPIIFVAAVAALTILVAAAAVFAQDDWEVIQHSSTPDVSADQPSAAAQPTASLRATSTKATSVCGEQATPAAPGVQAIVDRINGLWGSNFEVYQSVALEQPHASAGGCIFYNVTAMSTLMAMRLDVNDPNAVAPMMWAIFAHEAGHEYHRDSEASRANVPVEIKELEADRFAGYTLEKLKIRATDLTPFWTMTGDDYAGGAAVASNRHGSSEQRVAAFKQGWNMAEWNQPEDSKSVEDALNEPVAPDSPDSSPK
jgi:predicted metalloprotease